MCIIPIPYHSISLHVIHGYSIIFHSSPKSVQYQATPCGSETIPVRLLNWALASTAKRAQLIKARRWRHGAERFQIGVNCWADLPPCHETQDHAKSCKINVCNNLICFPKSSNIFQNNQDIPTYEVIWIHMMLVASIVWSFWAPRVRTKWLLKTSPRGWAEVLCSANISIHIQHLQRFQKDR